MKDFVEQVIIGRDQAKPTTECLYGVAIYPKGDMKQGRYSMAISDLMNTHCDKAMTEGLDSFKLGRADNEVAMGDIVVQMSISFACKDAMLDLEWLGIDMIEWPHQRLYWEMNRIEHLAYASTVRRSLRTMPSLGQILECLGFQLHLLEHNVPQRELQALPSSISLRQNCLHSGVLGMHMKPPSLANLLA